jgi:hypothetical protein
VNKDALPSEIFYDRSVRRYRYTGGEGQPQRGTFVSRTDVLKLQENYLSDLKSRFIQLSPRIKSGEIGVYKEAGFLLKEIHMSNAIIAAGGIDKLSNSDLGSIGNILKKQYYAGKGDKPFGLKHLFKEVSMGKVSDAQLQNRLRMYAEAGELSGSIVRQNIAINQGLKYMMRIDSGDDVECDDCIRYARAGWQPIGSLPMPKVDCRCRSNCRCRVVYGSYEQTLNG